jgi:hypothetical protein
MHVMIGGHQDSVAEKVCCESSDFHVADCALQAGYCSVLLARLFPTSAFANVDAAVVSDALQSPHITVQKVKLLGRIP